MARFALSLVTLVVIILNGCGDLASEVATIEVSPSSAKVGVQQVAAFFALARDANGMIVNIDATWSVDGNIGSINTNGLFSANSVEATGHVIATYGTITGRATVSVSAQGWLTGKIRTPDGGYAEGIMVYIKEHSSWSDTTDSSGDYTIADIVPGSYEVWTTETQLYMVASSEVTIVSGETTTWNTYLTMKSNVPTIPTTTLPF